MFAIVFFGLGFGIVGLGFVMALDSQIRPEAAAFVFFVGIAVLVWHMLLYHKAATKFIREQAIDKRLLEIKFSGGSLISLKDSFPVMLVGAQPVVQAGGYKVYSTFGAEVAVFLRGNLICRFPVESGKEYLILLGESEDSGPESYFPTEQVIQDSSSGLRVLQLHPVRS